MQTSCEEQVDEKIERIEKLIDEWLEEHDLGDYVRNGDTFFHERLEVNPDTEEIGVGTYSQNSWTEGWDTILTFPNGQDIANGSGEDVGMRLYKNDVISKLGRRVWNEIVKKAKILERKSEYIIEFDKDFIDFYSSYDLEHINKELVEEGLMDWDDELLGIADEIYIDYDGLYEMFYDAVDSYLGELRKTLMLKCEG